MKRKWILTAFVPLLSLTLITGCGMNNDNNDNNPVEDEAPLNNDDNNGGDNGTNNGTNDGTNNGDNNGTNNDDNLDKNLEDEGNLLEDDMNNNNGMDNNQ